jgi:hypothetical protein
MRDTTMRSLVTLVLVLAPRIAATQELSAGRAMVADYSASDPAAPEVTRDNLLESERFWPYQVALRARWQPPGDRRALGVEPPGVLVRVEASGLTRIDFGRDGLYEIPVGLTDVVERANRVRLGELSKIAPNFLAAVAPRLLDPGGPELEPFDVERAARHAYFLCAFIDPDAPGFETRVRQLAPLAARADVLTILFPLGRHPEAAVRQRLRELEWTVPFLYDRLAEPLARSLLPEGARLPTLLLQTREGRVLASAEWRAGAVDVLLRALERASGGAGAAE